jgi:hypothetical protein
MPELLSCSIGVLSKAQNGLDSIRTLNFSIIAMISSEIYSFPAAKIVPRILNPNPDKPELKHDLILIN